jgi:hypothetical protein
MKISKSLRARTELKRASIRGFRAGKTRVSARCSSDEIGLKSSKRCSAKDFSSKFSLPHHIGAL